MKYIISFLIFFLIFFNHTKAIENKILFKVDNEIITSLDILNEINYLEFTNKNLENFSKFEKFEIAKNSKINEKIKEIEILKWFENLYIEEKFLEPIIKNIYLRANLSSLEELENNLNKKNISLNEIKKRVSIELLWNQLVYRKYSEKIKINKKLIRNELLSKKNNLNSITEYELSEIIFDIQQNESLNDKYTRIKSDIITKKFEDAVLIHSISPTIKNSGYIGWIKETSLNNKIKKELKEIKKDEFTKPIVVPGGFLILKIKNLRKIEIKFDIEKEVNIATQKQTNEQLNLYSNIYFKAVKKNIEINEL